MSIVEIMIDIPSEHVKNVFGSLDKYIKIIERTLYVRGNEITEQNVNYALFLCFEEKELELLSIDTDVI